MCIKNKAIIIISDEELYAQGMFPLRKDMVVVVIRQGNFFSLIQKEKKQFWMLNSQIRILYQTELQFPCITPVLFNL